MTSYFHPRHGGILSRDALILVLFLTLVAVLSACGASSTAGPSHPSGSTSTSTPIKKLQGTITEFPLPANLYPGDITKGPDGNLWYIAFDYNMFRGLIGRITPSGTVSEFPIATAFVPSGITAGPDGTIWFTHDGNPSQNGKIGRITLTGKISEFPLPTSKGGPGAITGGPDGTIWFIETNSNKIGSLV